MEYAWECVEAARRRGLTTNSARALDAPLIDVIPTHNVAALSLIVVRSAGAFPGARARNVPETSEFSGVETGTRVRDSRTRCRLTTTYRDSSSRPLCERLPSSQLLGADVMKSLLALTLAAALAVACSKNEQQQGGLRTPHRLAHSRRRPQPASPPPAVTITAPAAESAPVRQQHRRSLAAPAKPAPSSPATSASTAAAPPPSQRPLLRRSLRNHRRHRRLRFAQSLFPPAHRSPYRC
jgi:hypothetical protein